MSSPLNDTPPVIGTDDDQSDILKNIKINNINRLVIGHLNINSIRNKFQSLNHIIGGNIDILVVTESKLDGTFSSEQFFINGYAPPYRRDREVNGTNAGGILVYIRDDIPSRQLMKHSIDSSLEGIFVEINLRKSKWLLFAGYNHNKINISNFLNTIGPVFDHYLNKFDNFLLLGDFNSEIEEPELREFCDIYNLSNLITEPTCFKNPENPSSIDLILTNKPRSFVNSCTIETGLSDHHKLTVSVLRLFFKKQAPVLIKYRNYKKFDANVFRSELNERLYNSDKDNCNYENFQSTFMEALNKHAPMKNKFVRANNAPFMNKLLSKAVMTRSRLKNKFLKNPNATNNANYKKQRNYCVNLFKREKTKYFNNLNPKSIADNKLFWKTINPLFSDKRNIGNKVTLIDNNNIFSDDAEVAEIFNECFSNVVDKLDIQGYQTPISNESYHDKISVVINKYKNHPSILKIRENVHSDEKFTFSISSIDEIVEIIRNLNKNKPTTFNNIPAKILIESRDICSPFISDIFNESIVNSNFPSSLKMADITPAHKKDETTNKDNYRPVSILPSISKIFERIMEYQICEYMNKHLSTYLCGFRKGYSTQHCLMVMLEKWRKALDKRNFAGALLTDLSKAFDCLNHELLIAKLDAYGFDHSALAYIDSYLTDRKQRTKVNNSFSSWSNILSGVPQGSILGPLLFNIYLNDIFFFINETSLTNYADDNTPYAINSNVDTLISTLENDTKTLIEWFNDNYFKMNSDKCHLLVTNHGDNLHALIGNETIMSSESVKLLGIHIDNKLTFNEHVQKLCKKVSLKLHAFSRISQYMSTDKLRVIMKAFIESQFAYCPLIWMFHTRALNNRINRLHEKALRLTYKNSNSSFAELLQLDNSFTIHDRNLQKLAIEMFKIKNGLSPSFMSSIFPPSNTPYNLRREPLFESSNVRTVYNGTETICFRGPKTWSLVPMYIKDSKSLSEFKTKIKSWKPEGCMCRLCRTYVTNLGFI